MRTTGAFVLGLFAVWFPCTSVAVEQCGARWASQSGLDMAPLIGKFEDSADRQVFEYGSIAYQYSGYNIWYVENIVCNNGEKPLIFSWPKARLGAYSKNALSSGKYLKNSIPTGRVAPSADFNSPIKFGFRGIELGGGVYQGRLNENVASGAVSISSMIEYGSIKSKEFIRELGISVSFKQTADGYSILGEYTVQNDNNYIILIDFGDNTSEIAEYLKLETVSIDGDNSIPTNISASLHGRDRFIRWSSGVRQIHAKNVKLRNNEIAMGRIIVKDSDGLYLIEAAVAYIF